MKSISVLNDKEIEELGYYLGCDLKLVLKELSNIK